MISPSHIIVGAVCGAFCYFLGALMAVAANADARAARKASMTPEGFHRLDRDVSRVVGPLSRN